MVDKNGVLDRIKDFDKVIIELGCGNTKKYPSSIGIDMVDSEGVDIIADLNKGLAFIPDNCVDEIFSSHFLEHVADLENIMAEMLRVLKPGGKVRGIVPHFTNPYYYSDYSHHVFFGLYTFSYFTRENIFKRRVPTHYNNIDFKINKIRLIFYSPFKIRNIIKKIYTMVFNCSHYMMELYEEIFCHILPAHVIEFELEKRDG